MRLFKFQFSLWFDVHWLTHFRKSWAIRGYWLDYKRPRNWVESISLGPVRLDVKVEGVLLARINGDVPQTLVN